RATAAELANQTALLRTAMEEGAWGMSTGLDYPPGSYADTAELIHLSREAGRLGGFYHTHVRYGLGDRFLDPFREAIEIGRRSEPDAGPRGGRAGGGARRHLRRLPLRVLLDAPQHRHPAVGVRRRPRPAPREPPLLGGSGADARGDGPAGGVVGRDVDHAPQAPGASSLRGALPGQGGRAPGAASRGHAQRPPPPPGPAGL